jgi:hypothetical protein
MLRIALIKNIFILLALISFSFSCEKQSTKPKPIEPVYKILFIGNSYLGYGDTPHIFKQLAESGGKKLFIDTAIRGGRDLDFHISDPTTLEKISEENWDYVVFQNSSLSIAYPETAQLMFPRPIYYPVKATLDSMMNLIKFNSTNTKAIYFMPWAYEDGITWIQGQTDTFESMQRHILRNSLQYSKELGFIIAPVGWAWFNKITSADSAAHLFVSDFVHPSHSGTYLSACVLYSTIYNSSPEGLPFWGDIAEDDAKYFQSLASATVFDNIEWWDGDSIAFITPTIDGL